VQQPLPEPSGRRCLHAGGLGSVLVCSASRPRALHNVQVVIVPIIKKDAERDAVLEAVKVLHTAATAAGLRAHLDADEGRTPGWKFNFWEMKVSWGNCCIRLTDSDMPMDGREPHMKLEVRLLKVCGTAALEGSTGLGAAVWTPQWTPQEPACRPLQRAAARFSWSLQRRKAL